MNGIVRAKTHNLHDNAMETIVEVEDIGMGKNRTADKHAILYSGDAAGVPSQCTIQ